MLTGRYKFKRRNNSSEGFLSRNRASTDALNALDNWSNAQSQRTYTVLDDEEELLLAELSWNELDDSVGPDLDKACQTFGVDRSPEKA